MNNTGSRKLKDKYRFYLIYPSKTEKNKATRKNLGNHCGCCIAVALDEDNLPIIADLHWNWEAATPIVDRENTPMICWGAVSREYLGDKCKHISKEKAFEIHPNLLTYLLNAEDFARRMNEV